MSRRGRINYEKRAMRRNRELADERYASTHSPEETQRHLNASRFPSGRWSHGGANRSSSMKREINVKTQTVALCTVCGGVTPEIFALTQLFPLCTCK